MRRRMVRRGMGVAIGIMVVDVVTAKITMGMRAFVWVVGPNTVLA